MWGRLYADEGRAASRSMDGLAKMVTVFVEACEAVVLTVSGNTETPATPTRGEKVEKIQIETAG